MSTITKERLEPVIERLEHYATNVKWTNVQAAKDMLIAVDAMRRLLASLEAEPVAYADQQAFRNFQAGVARREWMWRNPGEDLIPLFTAPPAPEVPDLRELEAILDWILMLPCPTPKATHFAKRLAVVIDACRDAMLQGADGNSPVIPDGWVLVPVEPTAEMQSAAAGAIRFDTTPINKLWTGNAVYRAMLAAAPQQEV